MRVFLWPLLGVVALLAAWRISRRLKRGLPVVAKGRVSRIIFRMAAGVLVSVSAFKDSRAMAPQVVQAEEEDPLPEGLGDRALAAWSRSWPAMKNVSAAFRSVLISDGRRTESEVSDLLRSASIPESLAKALRLDWKARHLETPAEPCTADEMIGLLNELEHSGIFHPSVASLVWRRIANLDTALPLETLMELHRRIELHARIADTLIIAASGLRPITVPARAWASKAGPSRELRESEAAAIGHLRAAVPPAWAKTKDRTVFATDGACLTVLKGEVAVTLLRNGQRRLLAPGSEFKLSRLDLLVTTAEAILHQTSIGDLKLPPDRVLRTRDLPALMSEQNRNLVEALVREGLEGSDAAASRLQYALPFVHKALARALREQPVAPGAPAFRMILMMFQDDIERPAADPPIRYERFPKERPGR